MKGLKITLLRNTKVVMEVIKAVVAVADTDTGEVFKTSFIRQIEVDEEQFAKLYLANFAAFQSITISYSGFRVYSNLHEA